MNHRCILLATVFGLIGLALPARAGEPKKPNVVLILADDLGYECLSCNGGTSYKTPQVDALAKSGLRFNRCYCTPLCSPSRVELMTGQYGFRTGWTTLIKRDSNQYLDPKLPTFGHVLRQAGYATGIAGKWQLCDFDKHPDHLKQCGFDEGCVWTWERDGKHTSRYWNPSIWRDGKFPDFTNRYGPDVCTDYAIDFLKRHKDGPFFFYYPMILVHDPFQPTPDSKADGNAKKQDGKTGNKAKWFPDMVARMDKDVGRIVAALDELGLRENTIILFTGDNGTPGKITSRMGDVDVPGGKGQTTHIGTHVPLVVNWKGGAPAGRPVEDLVDFSDVMPTLCEITGAKLPEGVKLDGVSFAPQIRGQASQPREWVFSQLGKHRFIRDKRFLLHEDGRLYDIEADPFEKHDLSHAGQPEADAAVKRLAAVLARLKK